MPYYLPPADGSRAYKNINDRTDKNYIRHEVPVLVQNIRGKEDNYHIDTAGFQYFKHTTQYPNLKAENEDEVAKYIAESADVYQKLTGAFKVHVFDHTIRRHDPGEMEESPLKRQPVSNVHVDQTPGSAVARVYRHFPKEEADELLKYRFQILNLWRPLSHPADDWPLGFIDSSTANVERDLFAMTLKFPGGPGETYAVKHHPDHRWVYLRSMQPDEIVLFKCFDSTKDEKIATFNAHTGFEDPITPKDASMRQSIELRAIVFYE